jgi:hypothetical protein
MIYNVCNNNFENQSDSSQIIMKRNYKSGDTFPLCYECWTTSSSKLKCRSCKTNKMLLYYHCRNVDCNEILCQACMHLFSLCERCTMEEMKPLSALAGFPKELVFEIVSYLVQTSPRGNVKALKGGNEVP